MDDRYRWAKLLADASMEPGSQPMRICEICVDMLGVTGAGISIATNAGNRGVICATDDVAARIEDLQLTLGEGPCVDAVRGGAPVMVPDLTHPGDLAVERWPAFMKGADAAGVRAVFAFPLRIGAISVGALDMYRDRPGEMTFTELPGALMAADAAALALLNLDIGPDGARADDLDGYSYQFQVHQATGMVQAQLGVTTEEAFLILRAHAFAVGRPLVDIGIDVVERRLRFPTEEQ